MEYLLLKIIQTILKYNKQYIVYRILIILLYTIRHQIKKSFFFLNKLMALRHNIHNLTNYEFFPNI